MLRLKCCVIIPTYNNEKTLSKVLDDVLALSRSIIIINDGSTDATFEILKGYSQVTQIQWSKNQGKGKALQAGFQKALELGFDYAITLDSDGQHFAQDIPVFINTLSEEPTKNILLIGARNMGDVSIPKKSSFGNKFSNFWFWFETGIRLKDTQCGFRLYPLVHFKDLTFYTSKFEFEIEVIVRAAWHGTTVKNVPVKVHYDELERVSHFRPIIDFTRISILNTWLVFLTIFYIKPKEILRKFKKKGLRRFFYEDFLHSNDTPRKKALSIALGVFIGLSPLWGFHTVIVIFLALLFKLNKVIAFAFSNISLPPFIPFVLYASSKVGQVVTGQVYTYSIEDITEHFEVMKHLKTYILGSILLSITSALILGLMAYVFLSIFDRKKIAVQNG